MAKSLPQYEPHGVQKVLAPHQIESLSPCQSVSNTCTILRGDKQIKIIHIENNPIRKSDTTSEKS
jgi:hypothetical protein